MQMRLRRSTISIMLFVVMLTVLPGCRGLFDDAGRVANKVGGKVDDVPPVVRSPVPDTTPKDSTDRIPDVVKDPKNAIDAAEAVKREKCKRDGHQC